MTIHVRNVSDMKDGDTITIGSETRKIANIGTAGAPSAPVCQPLPDGMIPIPVGSTNVPVTSAAGFVEGHNIALGYGGTFPTVPEHTEHHEVATVTAVGKAGTQAYLAAAAAAGATNIKVTSVENISEG